MALTRRKFVIGGVVGLGLLGVGAYLKLRPAPIVLGFKPDPEMLVKARALIAKHPSFDLHAHPGLTFARDASGLSTLMKMYSLTAGFEDGAVADMRAGGMNAVTFCTVADFQLLNLEKGKGLVAIREFEPGEAWASYRTQMDNLLALGERGLVQPVFNTSDILQARADGKIAALFGSEGGDFLGGSVERLHQCYADGLRVINPMHYHHNELGDIMTAEPRAHGLTPAGRAIIKEMNALGMVVDGSHSSLDSLAHILDVSDKPIFCSHTHILHTGQVMPRFISKELALRIAEADGVIGAWPAGLGISTMDGLITRILELVDIVGIDHVGLGTDMDANYKPVWDNYADFPLLVMRMLQRGLNEYEVAKIIGGNGLRVLTAVTGK